VGICRLFYPNCPCRFRAVGHIQKKLYKMPIFQSVLLLFRYTSVTMSLVHIFPRVLLNFFLAYARPPGKSAKSSESKRENGAIFKNFPVYAHAMEGSRMIAGSA